MSDVEKTARAWVNEWQPNDRTAIASLAALLTAQRAEAAGEARAECVAVAIAMRLRMRGQAAIDKDDADPFGGFPETRVIEALLALTPAAPSPEQPPREAEAGRCAFMFFGGLACHLPSGHKEPHAPEPLRHLAPRPDAEPAEDVPLLDPMRFRKSVKRALTKLVATPLHEDPILADEYCQQLEWLVENFDRGWPAPSPDAEVFAKLRDVAEAARYIHGDGTKTRYSYVAARVDLGLALSRYDTARAGKGDAE